MTNCCKENFYSKSVTNKGTPGFSSVTGIPGFSSVSGIPGFSSVTGINSNNISNSDKTYKKTTITSAYELFKLYGLVKPISKINDNKLADPITSLVDLHVTHGYEMTKKILNVIGLEGLSFADQYYHVGLNPLPTPTMSIIGNDISTFINTYGDITSVDKYIHGNVSSDNPGSPGSPGPIISYSIRYMIGNSQHTSYTHETQVIPVNKEFIPIIDRVIPISTITIIEGNNQIIYKNNDILSISSPGFINYNTNVIYPPVNTNIDLSELDIFDINSIKNKSFSFPQFFSWTHPQTDGTELFFKSDNDTDYIKDIKHKITIPQTQGSCGSCWAMSTCGIVSDLFVISGITDNNPDLSTTSLLTCNTENSQCDGGFPSKAAIYISDIGIKSNKCIDYSWCLKNDKCNGGSEFSQSGDLNKLIPKCGCYYDTNEHYIYKIDKNPKQISIGLSDKNANNPISQEDYENIVKNHILTNGPVSGSFILLKNFFSFGQKQYINKGIYLESIDYENSNSNNIVFTDKRETIGGHAVAIIGWGEDIISIGKDSIGNNTMKIVKYWLCRNSWGTEWATNGYFKMAMYPNNLISQFDKVTETIISGGGVMLMTVSREPELITTEVTDYDINKGLLMNKKYYMDNENINQDIKNQDIKNQDIKNQDIKNQHIKLKSKELKFYNVLNEITSSNLFYLLLFLILVYVVIY